MNKRIVGLVLLLAIASSVNSSTARAAADAAGSNVVSGGTVYFISASGQKQAYTSAGAFLSYGFNSWANVTPATSDDLSLPTGSFVPPMDGSLINDGGTVYVITGGERAAFTSAAVFTALGYSFSNVIPGDTSFLQSLPDINSSSAAHLPGAIILDHITTPPTAYLVTASGKDGIPSPAVFNSWGYSWADAVTADSFDWVLPQVGVMPQRISGYLSPLSQPASVSPTNPATGAVTISEVGSTGVTGTSATVTWYTDNLASSTVNYGTNTTYSATPVTSAALTLFHTIQLVGLQPNTTYHYDVSSQAAGGATGTSADATFTTSQAQASVSVTPTALTFGPIEVATSSDPQSITILNQGSAGLNIVSAVSSNFQFVVTGLSTTGLTPLPAGQPVTLSVVFNPGTLDTVTGSVTITFDAAPAQVVNLTGTSYPAPSPTPT